MSTVKNIALFREGDFKPNLYLDILSQIRDFSERDDAAYDFFVATEDMFTLSQSSSEFDFEIQLPFKDRVLGGLQDTFFWNIDDLEKAHLSFNAAFVMLASVSPKNHPTTAESCLKSFTWLALASSGDMMHAMTGEIYDRDEVTIIPFLTSMKYPSNNVYTIATNSRMVSIQNDLRVSKPEWFITELFIEEPSNASCVDTLFYPKLDVQNGVQVGDTIFQKGIQFSSLNLFSPESIAGRCPGVIKPEDFIVESNLSWQWQSDGRILFRLAENKHLGFLKIYLNLGDIIDYKHIHESELPLFQFKVAHY